MAQNLNGLPGGAELWRTSDTGSIYVVYFVPGTEPPVPLIWQVPSTEALAGYFPAGVSPTIDREMTQAELDSTGALDLGLSTELVNLGSHPFDQFVAEYEVESAVRPWLRDPEVLALVAGAFLEGRDLTEAELASTEWWQTHSPTEREWLSLVEFDPSGAQVLIDQTEAQIRSALIQAGVNNPSDALVVTIGSNVYTGQWTMQYAMSQVHAISDPASPYALDTSLGNFVNDELDRTRDMEQEVRNLVTSWLGSSFGAWDQGQIEHWAGRLRNDPDAETELIETLQSQRIALFPEYENPNLTFNDIVSPWRNMTFNAWGQRLDDGDPFLHELAKLNDGGLAAERLRSVGLERGVDQVVDDALGQMSRAFGQGISPSVRI